MNFYIDFLLEIILDYRELTIRDHPHTRGYDRTSDDYFVLILGLPSSKGVTQKAPGRIANSPSPFLADAEAKSRINR